MITVERMWIIIPLFSVIHWGCGESAEPPHIAPFRALENLVEGQRLSLLCSATTGTPPISFSWTKNGEPIGTLPDVKVTMADDDTQQLKIERLSPEHVGNYTCSAKNAFGSDQMSASVLLKFKPRWVTSGPTSLNGVAGERIDVDCNATGHPAPAVVIMKGMLMCETLYILHAHIENKGIISSIINIP